MAKEQWHSWGRTAVILAGIVFAGGGYVMKIRGNTKDIIKVEEKVETIQKDVHEIELNAKDIKAVAVRAAEAMISIDTKLSFIQNEQAKQATIQAVNSEKLKTLTKD